MSEMKFESIPRVFDFSFDNKKRQLILKIHRDFINSCEFLTEERVKFFIEERFLKDNNLNYKYCFNVSDEEFGFDGVFQKIKEDDEFIWFKTDDFEEPFKISASLHVFLFFAQFYYCGIDNKNEKTSSELEQKIQISTAFALKQSGGLQIYGSCSDVMSECIRNLTDEQIEEIIDTLVIISTSLIGEDQTQFRHRYMGVNLYNDIIQINYPSALSGLWLTVGKNEISGHNIDYARQQFVLLCALAKICDFCND